MIFPKQILATLSRVSSLLRGFAVLPAVLFMACSAPTPTSGYAIHGRGRGGF